MPRCASGACGHVEALVKVDEIRADRIDPIAVSLAGIRHFLSEIGRYADRPTGTVSVPCLGNRFRDLEGWLKELRNDRLPVRRKQGGCC